jgi:hypothetical protein
VHYDLQASSFDGTSNAIQIAIDATSDLVASIFGVAANVIQKVIDTPYD